MATALAELGVTESTLDPETAERLDRDGYAPLPGVLSDAQLDAIRARLAELLAAEGDQAGVEVHQEAGTDRLADLVNKGEMFQPCNWTRRSTSARRPWPPWARPPGSSWTFKPARVADETMGRWRSSR
jgi:hypothetical protein